MELDNHTPTGLNGDMWYIVNESWLQSWHDYVSSEDRSAPQPGAVNNLDLLETHDENDFSKQKAKVGIRLVFDYGGVNRAVWDYYIKLYGGGPAIVRGDLDIHLPPLDPKKQAL